MEKASMNFHKGASHVTSCINRIVIAIIVECYI